MPKIFLLSVDPAMRLLDAKTQQLVSLDDDQPIRYAILSHTWGKPDEEVTFQDVFNATGKPPQQVSQEWKERAGWEKIKSTCEEALNYDCEYLWVDTCCIDKSSSAELQEGINSMFRWYENAAICLAYLSDVTSNDDPEADSAALRNSRWFTRGWTLQELLAPMEVIFFDRHWNTLGTKESLATVIEEITGIDARYIYNHDTLSDFGENAYDRLSQASVAERMSWAAGRQTTRREDMAYCLLGIFDIYMPMLYGEGDRAFARLQEEIMKTSDDSTLLSWGFNQRSKMQLEENSLLAPNPGSFRRCRELVPSRLDGFLRPAFSTTQKGLVLNAPIKVDKNHEHLIYAILANGPRQSRDESGYSKTLVAIPLVSAGVCKSQGLWKEKNEYLRYSWCLPCLVGAEFLKGAEMGEIVIRRPSAMTEWASEFQIILRALRDYDLVGIYPPQPPELLLGTQFISLATVQWDPTPPDTAISGWFKELIPWENFDPNRTWNWHWERDRRLIHMKCPLGLFLVMVEYEVLLAMNAQSKKEWSCLTDCRLFKATSEEFQLDFLHDVTHASDFSQLEEVPALGRLSGENIFKPQDSDSRVLVVRFRSRNQGTIFASTHVVISIDHRS